MRPGVLAGGRGCLVGALIFAWAAASAEAYQVKEAQCPMGRQYFLFTPNKIIPQQTYWLVVSVHGFGGSGSAADPIGQWADRGDCIAISPTFPSPEFPLLGSQSGEQLVGLFKQLKGQYKLHPKLFITGGSGGSQYAHRFLMKYPQLVLGCYAYSGGSWSTGGGWGEINPAAATIPLAISCGTKDTEKMAEGAPWGRLEWCQRFEAMLKQNKFLHKARYWPNFGHGGDPAGNAQLTAETFSLGTSGMLDQQRAALDQRISQVARILKMQGQAAADLEIAKLRSLVKSRTANDVTAELTAAGWQVSPESVAASLQRTQDYLEVRLAVIDVFVPPACGAGVSNRMAGRLPGSSAQRRADATAGRSRPTADRRNNAALPAGTRQPRSQAAP